MKRIKWPKRKRKYKDYKIINCTFIGSEKMKYGIRINAGGN